MGFRDVEDLLTHALFQLQLHPSDNTLVMFLSDNGTDPYDRNQPAVVPLGVGRVRGAKGRDGDRKRTERFCLGDCLCRYGRTDDEVGKREAMNRMPWPSHRTTVLCTPWFTKCHWATAKQALGRLGDTWHLDEVFVTIQGQRQYLWRAVRGTVSSGLRKQPRQHGNGQLLHLRRPRMGPSGLGPSSPLQVSAVGERYARADDRGASQVS